MNHNWHQEETYKSLMLYGNNALKFVLLINGGAVIALLTFLGNLLKNNSHNIEINMSWSMGCFLLGIIIGGIANLTAYYAQLKLYNESIGNIKDTTHMRWVYITLGLVIFGILLFMIGSILTLNELQAYA